MTSSVVYREMLRRIESAVKLYRIEWEREAARPGADTYLAGFARGLMDQLEATLTLARQYEPCRGCGGESDERTRQGLDCGYCQWVDDSDPDAVPEPAEVREGVGRE